ncbi:hypothetical protein EN834_35850, partial [bacterium M00.F.Ca.ET.191.01.1.1]
MDTALTLTNDMKLVLGLVGFTMAMFLFERIRADVVALAAVFGAQADIDALDASTADALPAGLLRQ